VDTHTLETSATPAGSHEPGVSPNAGTNSGASLDTGGAAAAASPNTSNMEDSKTSNAVFPGQTITKVDTPAGKETVQSATIQVPLSYFVGSYKIRHPKSGDPSDADLAAYNTAQLVSIRASVKNIIGLKSEADLSVDTYADVHPDLALAAAPSVPTATLTTVTGHAREIGVAVLAVISLLMMATMVRKSAPAPLVIPSSVGGASAAAVARGEEINSLGSGESVAGEVGAGNSALDGMEMDEDAVRTQQMLDQVSTMVKENPDGAASLVKRWLSRA
jgi:flagellar biosynthesis/type III secretory pathway M-ring protein FliF/YscJ